MEEKNELVVNDNIFEIFNPNKEKIDITELPAISIIHPTAHFEMPDGSTRKEIECILLDTYRNNSYYASTEIVDGSFPDCWAIDYHSGEMKPDLSCEQIQAEKCSECKKNEWKSDPKGGCGKACRNGRQLIILIKDYFVPCILSVPPTSLKNIEKYLNSFIAKHIPYQAVKTKLQLDKKETYSTLKISTDGDFEKDINKLNNIKNIIMEYKNLMYRKPTLEIIPDANL